MEEDKNVKLEDLDDEDALLSEAEEEPKAPDVTIYDGKRYFSLKAAKMRFKIPQPTLYYWAANNKAVLLDLDVACAELPFKPGDLRHQYYFEEESLMECIRSLRGDKVTEELFEE